MRLGLCTFTLVPVHPHSPESGTPSSPIVGTCSDAPAHPSSCVRPYSDFHGSFHHHTCVLYAVPPAPAPATVSRDSVQFSMAPDLTNLHAYIVAFLLQMPRPFKTNLNRHPCTRHAAFNMPHTLHGRSYEPLRRITKSNQRALTSSHVHPHHNKHSLLHHHTCVSSGIALSPAFATVCKAPFNPP